MSLRTSTSRSQGRVPRSAWRRDSANQTNTTLNARRQFEFANRDLVHTHRVTSLSGLPRSVTNPTSAGQDSSSSDPPAMRGLAEREPPASWRSGKVRTPGLSQTAETTADISRVELTEQVSIQFVDWINEQLRKSIELRDSEIQRESRAARWKAYLVTGASAVALFVLHWFG